MCGRFALTTPQTAVTEHFGAVPIGLRDAPARWNICPTQDVDVIVLDDSERQHRQMRWGFLPRWYKTPSDGPLLINARSETIAEKPAFREACRETRCLIPFTGFYEWVKEADGRQPFFIHPEGLTAFAAVWRVWEGQGQRLETCAIVTCPANARLTPIHHRMPVVVAEEDYGLWLGEEGRGAATLMRPGPEDLLTFHKVSRAVNGARGEGEELAAPV